jgi:hypothetical protein
MAYAYGGRATATAARTAMVAGSAAVTSMASNTRQGRTAARVRLVSDSGALVRDGKESAKAKADGEDLRTALLERMAIAVSWAAQ